MSGRYQGIEPGFNRLWIFNRHTFKRCAKRDQEFACDGVMFVRSPGAECLVVRRCLWTGNPRYGGAQRVNCRLNERTRAAIRQLAKRFDLQFSLIGKWMTRLIDLEPLAKVCLCNRH